MTDLGKHDLKTVELTKRVIRDLDKVKAFNRELLGEQRAEKIVEDVFRRIAVLENTEVDLTEAGLIDGSFTHLKH